MDLIKVWHVRFNLPFPPSFSYKRLRFPDCKVASGLRSVEIFCSKWEAFGLLKKVPNRGPLGCACLVRFGGHNCSGLPTKSEA